MKRLLVTTALFGGLALAGHANAAEILGFTQNGTADTTIVTNNGVTPNATTTITDSGLSVTVGSFAGATVTPFSAFFNLTATSVGTAAMVGSFVDQDFSGSFSVTSNADGTGTNYLSGTFADAAFGTGDALTVTVGSATPGESVSFTSSLLTAAQLGAPQGVTLNLVDFNPAVSITDNSLGSGTSTIGGSFSATPAPEPASLSLLGVGLLGLGFLVNRKRSV